MKICGWVGLLHASKLAEKNHKKSKIQKPFKFVRFKWYIFLVLILNHLFSKCSMFFMFFSAWVFAWTNPIQQKIAKVINSITTVGIVYSLYFDKNNVKIISLRKIKECFVQFFLAVQIRPLWGSKVIFGRFGNFWPFL